MRITNSMMIDTTLRNLNNNMNVLNKYSSQLSSDRRIIRLSDDPIGVINSLAARQMLRDLNQYQKNITNSRKWVQQAETSLTDMESIIKTVYEETINAGGVKNPEDKQNIATLVKELREHLIETCNTAVGDKYIFGGFNTTTKPFTVTDAGKVLYNGIDLSSSSPPRLSGTFGTLPEVADPPGFEWSGDIYPLDDYTVTSTASGELVFTSSLPGRAPITVAVPEPKVDTTDPLAMTQNTIDMTSKGLGVITYYTTGGVAPTAQDIADALSDNNSGNIKVTSDLYHTATDIEFNNALSDPVPGANLTWDGPIAKLGKYYVSADTAAGTISIVDSNGTKIADRTLNAASGVLDLTDVGLGTITWDPSSGVTEAELAGALQDTGYVTTKLGAEAAQDIKLEIGYELTFDITFTGIDVVGVGGDNMFKILDDLIVELENGSDNEVLTTYLTKLTGIQDRLLTNIVQSGARTNRLDTMENRYSLDLINAEAIRGNVEDIDQAQTIMQYKYAEVIYQQALAAAAQIIQPSLMDFLR